MKLGPHALRNRVFVAPMAGVTDRPFRQLCKRLGAGYAVSEMAASNPRLWASVKTSRRTDHAGEAEPRAVQIAGSDPAMMAEAARHNVERGAQIIDINMGCPARKVCSVAAGSALMADEPLAIAIVEAVVRAVDVPVTVKMRTGPTPASRNAVRLARAFESAGAAMLAVHGRSRACAFGGRAEYATIAEVKATVSIPVVANGDIDSPQAARDVLRATGADAVMIGRAAQGRPWIFGQVVHFLETGELLAEPDDAAIAALLREHLLDHYAFHGEERGVRSARRHLGWYLSGRPGARRFLAIFNALDTAEAQLAAAEAFLAPTGRLGAANDTQFLRSHAA
ncbi:MAG: tRNA dihydrouridine synthase DusB [Lautropia sp.]|nr:MAG: tRNA dihydrouridine synthase DusB [Pseudomonadota bacterium]MBC6959549.1 tRNA dihydrouridine synthase DusB [Lautropia sp.]MCL4701720.1 tRNA dihydrouridine synthase DusB [Burkholderiaceae bacterium]MDL1906632.1 tRNA dihydrouridine synthase DusB [Betaproteobacteria bacterium PRO1]MEB2335804.1 tRNA dihydrouridine synthase DusB [Burkholderiales bacterium]